MSHAKKIDLGMTGYDELFMTEEERAENRLPKIYDIPLSEIDDFPDHPYRVLDDEDMEDLMESIKDRGIITPALVRRKDNGRYEIISGHRRKRACERLGIPALRCEVKDVNRDEAIILMVDSNSQRSEIAPTDKGKAYKMKMEALKRQGERTDLTSRPLVDKLGSKRSGEIIGEKMRPAVELSYLDEEVQRDIVDRIDETEAFPSHDQAIRIRKAYEAGAIDYDKVTDIMAEEKPNQKPKFKFSFERLRPLIPQGYADKQAEDYIVKALEYYKRYLQKQRDQAR